MLSNLPPGVTDDMIPGNSQEDSEFMEFINEVEASGRSASELRGLFALGEERVEGKRYSYDQVRTATKAAVEADEPYPELWWVKRHAKWPGLMEMLSRVTYFDGSGFVLRPAIWAEEIREDEVEWMTPVLVPECVLNALRSP